MMQPPKRIARGRHPRGQPPPAAMAQQQINKRAIVAPDVDRRGLERPGQRRDRGLGQE